MKIINLTPHAVTVFTDGQDTPRVFEPSGTVARVSTIATPAGSIDGIPVNSISYSDATDLPAPVDGVFLLVSSLVADKVKGRTDLLVPADFVRDDKGNIIGCKSLNRLS